MANPSISQPNQPQQDREIWLSLRQAIAKSSGFQSWQHERKIDTNENLDIQVSRYLKETLETLAY